MTRFNWRLALVVAAVVAVAAPFLVHSAGDLGILGVLPFLAGSVNDSVAQDKNTNFTTDTVRSNQNQLVRDFAYGILNRPAWQVAAAAVAPPVLAVATDTKTVKSTATSQLYLNGVPKSLTATDPLMVVANIAASDPNVLAIGSVRRWQVCWDGTSATTVITLRPSNDKVIASYASAQAALDACRWPSLPPAGTVIVGIVDLTNVTNVFTPGTTALDAAGVTDAYRDGPDANCFLASIITP